MKRGLPSGCHGVSQALYELWTSTNTLRAVTASKVLLCLREINTQAFCDELLDAAEAEGLSWSDVSHNGFRPMRALGYASAAAAWRDCMTKSPATWRGQRLHKASFLMPRNGLVHKVLRDRAYELSEWDGFPTRFLYMPIVPTTGGCTRFCALVQQRTMLHGTDWLPVKHPPQLLLQYTRRLQSDLRRESAALQLGHAALRLPDTQLNHWTEHVVR